MTKVIAEISMSLDGFIAGSNPTREEPLGQGGQQLHEWVVRTANWRARHGYEGGEHGVDDDVVDGGVAPATALVMGRGMFGGEGPWGDEPWDGWWGDEPPFGCPVFVLTHHEREPLVKGRTTFHFVTDGADAALSQARAAAGEGFVGIGGGADTIQQCVRLGAVDELRLHIVPVFLGGGRRLFDGLAPAALEIVETIPSAHVTHVHYALRN